MDLNEILIFTRVIEMGSFTAAGKRMGITKATVSRKVADLEARLGVRLLNRTTRQLHLTEIGQAFYHRCSKLIIDLNDAQEQVNTRTEQVKGKLKVIMPIELGQLLLGRFTGHFMQRYPDVDLDVELTNRQINMIQEGIDVHIRIGLGQDSNQIARYLGSSKKILVATPQYLHKNKQIKQPQDLVDHECVVINMPGDTDQSWHFSKDKTKLAIQIKGSLHCNNVTFAKEAILSGIGVGYLPLFLALPYYNDKRLIRVLPDWDMDSAKIYALYQSREFMPKLLNTFLEAIFSVMNEIDQLKSDKLEDWEIYTSI